MSQPKLRIWQSNETSILVEDRARDSFLRLDTGVKPTAYQSVTYHFPLRERLLAISTGRDMTDYIDHIDFSSIDLNDQFIEVGAGFGEFVPLMVEHASERLHHRPIIIDPIDYSVARDHLKGTLDQHGGHSIVAALSERILAFVHRCNVLLGEDVLHIRGTLGQAIRLHGETVLGKGDCVISLNGPITHFQSECDSSEESKLQVAFRQRKRVRDMHHLLLKDPHESILVAD